MGRDIAAGGTGFEVKSGSGGRASRRHERTPSEVFLDAPDPSIHMLGLPKARPRFGSWLTIAICAGILIALALVFVTSF